MRDLPDHDEAGPGADDRPIVDAAAPFGVDELFFSRTDGRGVIVSGNEVFRRVSLYDWDEMLRRPHRIIRHPDMPRAVFRLLWSEIGAGRPIGAYVKNRAEDGRYYWVFAIVTPIAEGYLSVRLKPTSDLLATVEGEYRAIRRRELREGLPPDEATAALAARLGELGFETYASFMATALAQEIRSRDAAMGRRPDEVLAGFERMAASVAAIRQDARRIVAALRGLVLVPYNIRIQAMRLGEAGGPVGVIASNYQTLSNEIQDGLQRLVEALDEVFGTVNDGLFLIGTARIQAEVAAAFEGEEGLPAAISKTDEMARLGEQRDHYAERAALGSQEVGRRAAAFADVCARMSRIVAGLNVTRILCKMEGERIGTSAQSLSEVVGELDEVQRVIAECLAAIEDRNISILRACTAHSG
jgi:aerotaxis receptor